MTPLFKKLNLKVSTIIHALNAPSSFEAELSALKGITVVRKANGPVSFAIAFAVTQAELDSLCGSLVRCAAHDAVLWVAYPKGTSRKYHCEFTRDSGWAVLGAAGYEPVRMVAIDEDWTALRFRHAEVIKSFTRNPAGAISRIGKRRASARRPE